MARYHINPESGKPNICHAQTPDACQFAENGQAPEHYDTKEEARAGYEKEMSDQVLPTQTSTENTKTTNKTYMDEQDAYHFFTQHPAEGENTRDYVRSYLQGMSYTENDVEKLAQAHEADEVAYNYSEEGGYSVIPDEETARDEADYEWDTGAYGYHPYDELEGTEEVNEELRLMGETAQKILDTYPPENKDSFERYAGKQLTRIAESPENTPLQDVRDKWETIADYSFAKTQELLAEIAGRKS